MRKINRAAARRAVLYEQATIGYNVAEGVVAVGAGFAAGSIALVGFGFDSAIEVAAASVVLRRLTVDLKGGEQDPVKDRFALRFIAATFFLLAAYVVFEGSRNLITGTAPDTSWLGIVLTGISLLVMPFLAWGKRRAGEALGSRLVLADAAETRLCAWLSASTFAGLVTYAAAGWLWLDPLAGFVIAGFALREGTEAWKGEMLEHGDRAAETPA